MKLKVNKEKCIGCGQCVSLCEEVFDFDDDNLAKVKENPVPEDIEEEAKQNAIDVPSTNLIKEQTTIIQSPIIIQTDEQGRIKSVHNVSPNGQLSSNNANVLINKDETPSIETRRDDEWLLF